MMAYALPLIDGLQDFSSAVFRSKSKDWQMMYDGHMWWSGGWFMMLLWTVFLIVAILWIIRSIQGRNHNGSVSVGKQETALDILNRRYAKGEVTKEEYEKIKRDIGS